MNEFVDIIVIYIVLRAILAFLGAWWHGDGRNDFRRDRLKDWSQWFCVLFLNDLYEHHCYRKYSDNLNESSEGFFWEEFYQTDSEQGSDSYYRKHQEVQ